MKYTTQAIKSFSDKDPHNLGAKLEAYMLSELLKMDFFDCIYHERDLIQLYGWECSSIDILIVKGDYIIPTQQKWRNTKRRETYGIMNFVNSINYIQEKLNKKVLFGLWSSKIHPFDDNVSCLESERVICVSHYNDIHGLVQKSIQTIRCELHKHGIF
jgi:hypothetical protein